MSTSKIDKLPPTKLQIRLLNVFVDELGWGGGVHSLYRHLQREFGKDRIHPAMDDNGNVLFENGEFWEEAQNYQTTQLRSKWENVYVSNAKSDSKRQK